MFIIKNNYYLYIENTKDININNIKKIKKSLLYIEIIKSLKLLKI